jgi:hypothetical protein
MLARICFTVPEAARGFRLDSDAVLRLRVIADRISYEELTLADQPRAQRYLE